jgi:hypothetical protein
MSSFSKIFQLGQGILTLDFASQKRLSLQFGWTDFDKIKTIEAVTDEEQKYGSAFFLGHPVW